MCNFRCFITKKGEKTSWRTGVTAELLWPRGFKNLNMHDSTCVCVLYNISEVCVCDDSLPVDPQGLEWEQVYCSVSQPCQDTRTHRASHVHLSPPLISLCLFLYFALSLFTSPTYLQSLFFCPPSLLVSSSCYSALLLLLPNELNPTTPFTSFFICIPCLCLNLTKCPRVIVWALSRPWGTLVLSLLLFHYVSLMGLWGFISPRRKSLLTLRLHCSHEAGRPDWPKLNLTRLFVNDDLS